MMTVSVVIPAFRAAAFLGATLASVAAQTRLPDEVIVVDDASPDDCESLAKAWAATVPFPVQVLRMPHNSGGPAKPLNVGINAATGEFIATLDHDDRWLPTKLARQLEAAERLHEPSMIVARCRCENASEHLKKVMNDTAAFMENLKNDPFGDDVYLLPPLSAYDAIANRNFPLTCSALLFPKSIWAAVGGFDESLTVNVEHGFLEAALRRFPLAWIDEALVDWTYRGDSLNQSGPWLKQSGNIIAVLSRFDRSALMPATRRELRNQLRGTFLGVAYLARQSGQYRLALQSYLQSLPQGISMEALAGIAKLLPHWLLRRTGAA